MIRFNQDIIKEIINNLFDRKISVNLYLPVYSAAFANSLDPDQARQNVGPDLDTNCLTL